MKEVLQILPCNGEAGAVGEVSLGDSKVRRRAVDLGPPAILLAHGEEVLPTQISICVVLRVIQELLRVASSIAILHKLRPPRTQALLRPSLGPKDVAEVIEPCVGLEEEREPGLVLLQPGKE